MLTPNDVAEVYDTILCIPGMNDNVKINLKLSRKNVLLLSSSINRGLRLKKEEKPPYLLKNVPEEDIKELIDFSRECLEKAGLVDLSEKLDVLGQGG